MRTVRGALRAVALGAALALAAPLASPASAAPGAATPAPAPAQSQEPTGQLPLTGSTGQHDPTLYTDGETYYVAATHGAIYSAPTLNGEWTYLGNVDRADWTEQAPFSGALWAPHVQKIGDTFYYYYSTTGAFGGNNSALGLKTTTTPGDPSSYVDHGAPILASGTAATHPDLVDNNAIDPAVLQDEDGAWWIVWGSHFDGIMMQRLEDDLVTVTGPVVEVADRASEEFPVTNPNFNRLEGPAIFERDGYYYLLVAWDWCCRGNGNDNTYKIVVGRSENISGPYLDKNGVDLAEGGGTIILNSRVTQEGVTPAGLHRAPGGADVLVEDGTYYMVYHSYAPRTVMGIRPMNWHGGWPYFQEEGDSPYNLQDGAFYRLINQAGHISDPNSLQNPEPSDRCLTAQDDGNVVQTTCGDAVEQYWQLDLVEDGFYRWRSLGERQDRCLAMEDAVAGQAPQVRAVACDEGATLQEWYFDDTGHGFHRLVVRGANLAMELENTDGVVGTEVIGAYRRDGDHQAGNLTQAAKWPPQQWRFEMVSPSAADLLATWDELVAAGDILGAGRGNSDAARLSTARSMLEQAVEHVEQGRLGPAAHRLDALQRRIHSEGRLEPSHFVTGAGAGSLVGRIAQLRTVIGG